MTETVRQISSQFLFLLPNMGSIISVSGDRVEKETGR